MGLEWLIRGEGTANDHASHPCRVASTCPASPPSSWALVPTPAGGERGHAPLAGYRGRGVKWEPGFAGSDPSLAQSESVRPQTSLDGLRVAPDLGSASCSGGCIASGRGAYLTSGREEAVYTPCSRLFSPASVGRYPRRANGTAGSGSFQP